MDQIHNVDHPQDPVGIKHVLELQSKLCGKVDWRKFNQGDLQPIIDSPRLSGAHFEEFLRRGCRMQLEDLPIRVVEKFEFQRESKDWQEIVRNAKYVAEQLGIVGHYFSGAYECLKPKNWKPKHDIEVLVFEIIGKERVEYGRLIELFALLDAHPATLPDVTSVLFGFRPPLHFEKSDPHVKGWVVPSAVMGTLGGYVDNLVINTVACEVTQATKLSGWKYKVGPIGGDIDDLGYWNRSHYYLATRY